MKKIESVKNINIKGVVDILNKKINALKQNIIDNVAPQWRNILLWDEFQEIDDDFLILKILRNCIRKENEPLFNINSSYYVGELFDIEDEKERKKLEHQLYREFQFVANNQQDYCAIDIYEIATDSINDKKLIDSINFFFSYTHEEEIQFNGIEKSNEGVAQELVDIMCKYHYDKFVARNCLIEKYGQQYANRLTYVMYNCINDKILLDKQQQYFKELVDLYYKNMDRRTNGDKGAYWQYSNTESQCLLEALYKCTEKHEQDSNSIYPIFYNKVVPYLVEKENLCALLPKNTLSYACFILEKNTQHYLITISESKHKIVIKHIENQQTITWCLKDMSCQTVLDIFYNKFNFIVENCIYNKINFEEYVQEIEDVRTIHDELEKTHFNFYEYNKFDNDDLESILYGFSIINNTIIMKKLNKSININDLFICSGKNIHLINNGVFILDFRFFTIELKLRKLMQDGQDGYESNQLCKKIRIIEKFKC